MGMFVDVFVGIGLSVGVDEPDGMVGTTTLPELSTWANAGKLPKNKDKPRLLKDNSLRNCDDINHCPVEIGQGID
jgi:hypothetical protein